ncbi:MAG: metallophosphoesterase family protein [Magnetospiraceae bacterium]
MGLLQNLKSALGPAPKTVPALPPGMIVYAIPDIHGYAALLRDVHARIENDLPPDRTATVVYLGDYVDRGPDSAGVIDAILDWSDSRITKIPLLGNHEDMMTGFLDTGGKGVEWLYNGGNATLASYAVEASPNWPLDERMPKLWEAFAAAIPDAHLQFLRGLRTTWECGDYFFVHAGVRPGVPLEKQEKIDLIWIRDTFLRSREHFGKMIVHGHSCERHPEFHTNRIALDACVYRYGELACLRLEGEDARLLL